MDSVVSVADLRISFTSNGIETEVVKGVSFNINRGECLALVGESGSGKSLSAFALLGLLPSTAKVSAKSMQLCDSDSCIALGGLDETGWRKLRGRKIAMIFQEPMSSLNPVMTCGEQVSEALIFGEGYAPRAARQKTLELFAEVKLPDIERAYHSYPHQLSGGQRQRVVIAMALSCNPVLLIADEPTTALDVTVQKSILDLLKELQHMRGMSMLFISHDLNVVAGIAQHILVMYRGAVIEAGTAPDILSKPKDPYTLGLLSCRPSYATKGKRLLTVDDVIAGYSSPLQQATSEFSGTGSTGDVLLSIQGLNVHYRRSGIKETFHALKNITIKVYQGETLGLVGESGCGKSTLSRAILRLIPTSGGKMVFNGQEIHSLVSSQFKPFRKKMQLVFQDPYSSLNPRIRAGDAVMEVMFVHGVGNSERERKELALQLLKDVGLNETFFYRYPSGMSGGQRQRLVIARALAPGPDLLICDESVAALDVSIQAQVLNLLNSLKERMGLTMIFISHDLSVIAHMCDHIAVMKLGEIVEYETTESIIERPQHPYTRQLLSGSGIYNS
jgi:peptide/nickel transport system ATP-binding protein